MNKADSTKENIYVSPQRFVARHRHARRTHIYFEASQDFILLFLLDGSLKWSAPEETNSVKTATRGDILFFSPGTVCNLTEARLSNFLLLTISPTLMLDCAARSRLTRGDASISFLHQLTRDEKLLRLARDLVEELQEDSAGRELVIESLIEQTLVYVLRRHANIQQQVGLELSRAGLVDRRIRRAVELMHAQLERELQLDELAASAHLSPFHFARLFKKLTGATPHSYLAALRLARAQDLLAETDYSITEIGARVGYASSSHFSKAFRQATGLTPSAFRKALIRP